MLVSKASASNGLVEATQGSLAWHRFRKHRLGVGGLVVLALIALAIVAIPIFSPFDYGALSPSDLFATVGAVDPATGNAHWLGTDYYGRDFLTRVFYGGRISLAVALLSTVAIVIIGSIIGVIAGYYGGWIDTLLMRFTDFMSALPFLPIYLITIRLIQTRPRSDRPDIEDVGGALLTIVFVFTLFGWMGICRLVRGSTLSLRAQEFVEASRALGASNGRIIAKHLLPNCIGPISVAATLAAGDFVIMESVVSYFGHGLKEAIAPSWGNMLSIGQNYIWNINNLNPFQEIRAYLIIVPTVLVLLTVLSINYIGEALRDAVDPR